jgi:SAM-dependent methyltransferase
LPVAGTASDDLFSRPDAPAIYEQITPTTLVNSLPDVSNLWTRMILDGEQGMFSPPLYQEHDFGVLMNAGDLYVRQALTPGEQLTIGMARGRVLELGAGYARVSRHLRDLGLKVLATDADPELVAMYKTRGWSDARQVTLPDIPGSLGKFDTVIALRGVLGLAGELDLVLRSIRQIRTLLNPGGRLIFTSSRVHTLLMFPGRSPLEYRVRFIYRGCRSPWLRATAIPEWIAIPLLKEEGFVTVETVESSTAEGAGYYVFATASA